MSADVDSSDPQVARAQARTGNTLRGKWHLDRLLGVGGMAAVYSATHRNGTRAAVKLLHPELSPHDEVKSRFLKEGYLANKVEHSGVVRVLDDDVAEDGSIYLVMDLLDGESVEARRERKGGRLDAGEVLSIADQVLSVLSAANDQGIVHRDIKPENIFLTRDGVIKVLDFGIARLRELSSTAKSDTQTGSTLGTPAYMAPEHARGLWEEVDAQSDLWSLGATLFNLATGRLVHEGRTVNEQLAAAIVNRALAVRAIDPRVPEPLAELIDRALAYDKGDRWTDAQAMQEATRVAYDAIRHAPIESCPPLAVPESVPDRTLAALDALPPAPRLPSNTGASVVSGRTGVRQRRQLHAQEHADRDRHRSDQRGGGAGHRPLGAGRLRDSKRGRAIAGLVDDAGHSRCGGSGRSPRHRARGGARGASFRQRGASFRQRGARAVRTAAVDQRLATGPSAWLTLISEPLRNV